MLRAKTRWVSKEIDETAVEQLAKKLKRDPLVVALCYLRGLKTVEEIERFLDPAKQELYDPFLLKGMTEAVERIQAALERNEKIMIYGDYDADGVASTTILYYLLQQLEADFDYTIPNRFSEGYGLHKAALERIAAAGYTLVITVDTGISAFEEVTLANELGLDVIITDHHEPPEQLPPAFAIVNPKQEGCKYPYPYLCGAGVALKLAQALLGDIPEQWFAYAAIGTIADLVPLLDENRLIAIRGLKELEATKQIGLKALLKESGIDGDTIDAGQIGFAIGPRINAAGRLQSADIAVRLLTTYDTLEAEQLAKQLNQLNQERQEIVRQISVEAELQAAQLQTEGYDHVLVVAGEEWHEGVIGIVASRLVERYYRPTIVLSIDREKGVAKGSARSIEGFDLYQNLTQCKDLLLKYGGHTMAAGLSIAVDKIPALRKELNDLGQSILSPEQLKPKMDVELTCSVSDIMIPFLEQLSQLAPFGVNNPEPKLQLRDLEIVSQRAVGSNAEHLKWVFQQADAKIDAIGFRFGQLEKYISQQAPIHVVAEVGINEWNGVRKPQLLVRDLAIDQLQLFDYRGSGKRVHLLQQMEPLSKSLLLYFREENRNHLQALVNDERFQILPFSSFAEISVARDPVDHSIDDADATLDVVLFDLPTSYSELHALQKFEKVERIWLLFGDEMNEQGLTKIPDRDTFKWLYSYFVTNKTVALDTKIWEIVKWKRLKEAELRFMVQVFLELEFIYELEGLYRINESPQKRSFEESRTYQAEKERIEVETELLFSSTESISKWFISEHGLG